MVPKMEENPKYLDSKVTTIKTLGMTMGQDVAGDSIPGPHTRQV